MSELIDRWERTTDAMAERLVESWGAMAQKIGDRPLWNEQLPERTQARQYQLVRNDPQAWAALMQEHGYIRTVEYMVRGERLSAKYPDEAQAGQEAIPVLPPNPAVAAAVQPQPATTPTLAEQRHTLRQPQEINLSEGQIGAA